MKRHRDPDGGYILVTVLSVMLLLTALLAAGSMLMRSALHGAVIGDSALAMRALTQGGLELTAYQIFVRRLPVLLVDGRKIRFAGGTIQPRIADEAGKVDLNGADPRLLAGIFASIGIDGGRAAALVARVVELRGPGRSAEAAPMGLPFPVHDIFDGRSPIASGLATSSTGAGASRAEAAQENRLRGWQSVDQLREESGLTRTEFRVLMPLLTVYNPDGRVDVLTASRAVLTAIPGLAAKAVDAIMTQRIDATKDPVVALRPMLGDASLFIKTVPGPAYSVRVDVISKSGQKNTLQAVIAASKSPSDPYLVLDWRDGAS